MSEPNAEDRLQELLVGVRRIAVLSGAGMSAPSGVPTFRGPGGLWNGHRAMDLATPEAFEDNPRLVWQFYDWRRTQLAACTPNAGHLALVALERHLGEIAIATQNVDGLHARAGSRRVLELHGNIWRVRCVAGCGEIEDFRAPIRDLPPRCTCGALLRPGVVWFGEALPWEVFEQAEAAIRAADLLLVVGTSGVVEPAASLARVVRDGRGKVVEINPDASALSSVATLALRESADVALPRIAALLGAS